MSEEKISVKVILNPMLLAGTFTREEMIAELRKKRPDLASPSSTVSKRFMLLQAEGKQPAIKETARERKTAATPGTKRAAAAGPASSASLKERLAKIDEWAARADEEIMAGFRRRDEFLAKAAKEPKMRRIWP